MREINTLSTSILPIEEQILIVLVLYMPERVRTPDRAKALKKDFRSLRSTSSEAQKQNFGSLDITLKNLYARCSKAACPAAKRAIGTRKGEQET